MPDATRSTTPAADYDHPDAELKRRVLEVCCGDRALAQQAWEMYHDATDPLAARLDELHATDPALWAAAVARIDQFLDGDDQALDVTGTVTEAHR